MFGTTSSGALPNCTAWPSSTVDGPICPRASALAQRTGGAAFSRARSHNACGSPGGKGAGGHLREIRDVLEGGEMG